MKRKQISGDFGYYEKVDHPVAVAAAKAVANLANGKAEAILFLDMLGLIAPQPGNEIVPHKRSAQVRRERQERIENETIRKLGVTPDEIGEDEPTDLGI